MMTETRAWIRTFALSAMAAAVALAVGCGGKRVHYLTDFRYPPKPADEEMAVYYGVVSQPHEVFARVQSRQYGDDSAGSKQRMLEDLENEARKAGADAVQNVRLLNVARSGYVSDPSTPFPSVMQQATARYFLRGDALKFIDPGVDLEPSLKREPMLEFE